MGKYFGLWGFRFRCHTQLGPDSVHNLFGSSARLDHRGMLRLFQRFQLTGEHRFRHVVTVAGLQSLPQDLFRDLEIDEFHFRPRPARELGTLASRPNRQVLRFFRL